jgi:chaperonin GroES
MTKMKILPISDQVLIRPDEPEEQSAGGVIIPDQAKKPPRRGTVLAFGPGRMLKETGERFPVALQIGDAVLYNPYSGSDVEGDGEDLRILTEDEVLAVVDEE